MYIYIYVCVCLYLSLSLPLPLSLFIYIYIYMCVSLSPSPQFSLHSLFPSPLLVSPHLSSREVSFQMSRASILTFLSQPYGNLRFNPDPLVTKQQGMRVSYSGYTRY